MNVEDVLKENADYLITETLLKVNVSTDKIISLMRQHRTTGQMTVYFIDGGVRSIMLTEKTKASETDRVKIREILRAD